MCEKYLLSIECMHFYPAKHDRWCTFRQWAVNEKCRQDRCLRRNGATNDGQFVLFRVIFNWLSGSHLNVGDVRSDGQTMQQRDDAATPIAGKGSYCLDAY